MGHQLLGCNLRDRRVGLGFRGGGSREVFITPPLPPQLTANKWCLHLFQKKKNTAASPLPSPPPDPERKDAFSKCHTTRPKQWHVCKRSLRESAGGGAADVNPERGWECSVAVGAPSSSSVTDRSVLGHVSSPRPHHSSLQGSFTPSRGQSGVGRSVGWGWGGWGEVGRKNK